MKKAYIVNFSGGKDSTAMLLWLLEKQYPVDAICFMDTGLEFPVMYDHIQQVQEYIGPDHVIHRVSYNKSFDYYFMDYVRTKGKMKGLKGYGFAKANTRWCTRKKIMALESWAENTFPDCDIVHYVAIAADESDRAVVQAQSSGNELSFPLIEWNKTEADALEYCYSKGFTWGRVYQHRARLSCWCCPLQSLDDLRYLYKEHPILWQRLCYMQERSLTPFRPDWTLSGLEQLFSLESGE